MTDKLIKTLLAAEKLHHTYPAPWTEALYVSAYEALAALAAAGDEDALDFFLWRES